MLTFLNIILCASIFQGLCFVGYGLVVKADKHPALPYLLYFVLFLSLNNLQVVGFVNGFFRHLGAFQYVECSWYLLIIPYFHAFVAQYLNANPLRYIRWAWLLIGLQLVIRLGWSMGIAYADYNLEGLVAYGKWEEILNLLVSLVLYADLMHTIRRAIRTQKWAQFDNLKWLQYFVYASGVIVLFWTFAVIYNSFETTSTKWMYNPLRISTTLLLYGIAYVGLIKMNQLLSLQHWAQVADLPPPTDVKTQQTLQADFERIEAYLEQHRSYCDAQFGLERLAMELRMSRSYLSKCINQQGISFSDYINLKRVKAAQQLLLKPSSQRFTIEVLAYECGFKSKSNFFFQFKKITDCTPSEWIKTQLESSAAD